MNSLGRRRNSFSSSKTLRLQGLQLDLVDALTTPAVRDGEQRLCTLRAALAITPTYWDEQAPETLATRISAWGGSMYSLDVPANQTDIAPDLIGRYLQCSAAERRELAGRHASVSTAVPNACDDCPFDRRDTCHALFGATEAGHGLFPLTLAAAVTTARLANRETFRPRMVLTHVVGPVIAERARLNSGQFPARTATSRALSREQSSVGPFRNPLEQLGAIEQAKLSAADRQRAETVLRVWNVNSRPNPADVLAALAPRPLIRRSRGWRRGRTRGGHAVGKQVGTPRDERLREIEQWAAGGIELKARAAQTARRVLFDELRAGYAGRKSGSVKKQSLPHGLRGSAQVQMNLAVRIANTAGGGASGAADPLVVIEPNVANARLQGLLLRDRHGSWAFPGGLDALSRIRIIVRDAENDLVRRLEADQFSRKFLTDAAGSSFSRPPPWASVREASEDDPLAAALTVLAEHPAGSERSKAWNDFAREACASTYEHALDLIRRGSGRRQGVRADITAIDMTRFDRND